MSTEKEREKLKIALIKAIERKDELSVAILLTIIKNKGYEVTHEIH